MKGSSATRHQTLFCLGAVGRGHQTFWIAKKFRHATILFQLDWSQWTNTLQWPCLMKGRIQKMTKAPKTPGDSQGAKTVHQRTGRSLTTGEMAREGETPGDPKRPMNRCRRTQVNSTTPVRLGGGGSLKTLGNQSTQHLF